MQCVVTGKVQGVAYRTYVQDSADALGLTGWVRHGKQGEVLVCAQGEIDTLKSFVEYLHEGSLKAVVEGVDVTWGSPREVFTDFSIHHA